MITKFRQRLPDIVKVYGTVDQRLPRYLGGLSMIAKFCHSFYNVNEGLSKIIEFYRNIIKYNQGLQEIVNLFKMLYQRLPKFLSGLSMIVRIAGRIREFIRVRVRFGLGLGLGLG